MATKKAASPKKAPEAPKKTTAPVASALKAPTQPPKTPGKAALVEKLKQAKNIILCGLPINAIAPIDEVMAELLKD